MKTQAADEIHAHLPPALPRAVGAACAGWSVGGALPDAIAFPRTTDEVAEVLAVAHRRGWSTCAAGNGTFLISTLRNEPVSLVVSTRDLNEIVHYEPADLVLTTGAGTTLRSISTVAAGEGQFFASDPAAGEEATIGAIAASASNGPLIPGFGRAKDLILGATLVTGNGRVLQLGGRVVKNVAGFDLLKLAIGSGGRLGVITEVSIRLHGIPAEDRVRVYRGTLEETMQVARALAMAPEMPASLELLCPMTCRLLQLERFSPHEAERQWGVLLRTMGNADTVSAAVQVFDRHTDASPVGELANDDARQLLADLARSTTDSGLSIRLSLSPSRLGVMMESVQTLREQLVGSTVAVHATEGVARMEVPKEHVASISTDHWALMSRTRAQLAAIGGAFWLTAAPSTAFSMISPRADRPETGAVQRRLLQSFDPGGVFRGAHGIA